METVCIQQDLRGVTGWLYSTEAQLIKSSNTIYKSTLDCDAIYDEVKTVNIDGDVFTKTKNCVAKYKCCTIDKQGYRDVILYRGNYYTTYGYRGWTQDEVHEVERDLSKYWKDVHTAWKDDKYHIEDNMDGTVAMIIGNTLCVRRTITKEELLLGYKGLLKKAEDSGLDCDIALKRYVRDVSNYLCISENQFKSGKYNLTDKLINRIHLKINNKNKNQIV